MPALPHPSPAEFLRCVGNELMTQVNLCGSAQALWARSCGADQDTREDACWTEIFRERVRSQGRLSQDAPAWVSPDPTHRQVYLHLGDDLVGVLAEDAMSDRPLLVRALLSRPSRAPLVTMSSCELEASVRLTRTVVDAFQRLTAREPDAHVCPRHRLRDRLMRYGVGHVEAPADMPLPAALAGRVVGCVTIGPRLVLALGSAADHDPGPTNKRVPFYSAWLWCRPASDCALDGPDMADALAIPLAVAEKCASLFGHRPEEVHADPALGTHIAECLRDRIARQGRLLRDDPRFEPRDARSQALAFGEDAWLIIRPARTWLTRSHVVVGVYRPG